MPKTISAIDIFFEQKPGRETWTAWFSVSWSDQSLSSWSVNLPSVEETELPGIPDHEWLAAVLATAARREVQPGDINVVMDAPNLATVRVEGWKVDEPTAEQLGLIVTNLNHDGICVQLPMVDDVSRETRA